MCYAWNRFFLCFLVIEPLKEKQTTQFEQNIEIDRWNIVSDAATLSLHTEASFAKSLNFTIISYYKKNQIEAKNRIAEQKSTINV